MDSINDVSSSSWSADILQTKEKEADDAVTKAFDNSLDSALTQGTQISLDDTFTKEVLQVPETDSTPFSSFTSASGVAGDSSSSSAVSSVSSNDTALSNNTSTVSNSSVNATDSSTKKDDPVSKNLTNTPSDNTAKKPSTETKKISILTKKPVVTSNIAPSIPQSGASKYSDIISDMSKKYNVPEKLIYSIIQTESNFDPKAVSGVGAEGLMQLMPSTASDLGVKDPFNPAENIEGGVKYIGSLLKKYNGNATLAVAAYNAGPGNVDKYGGVPPFTETQNYVKKVLG